MTNGEKIKEIFPNCKVIFNEYKGNIPCLNSYSVIFDDFYEIELFTGWWNAEYKEPTTKDDLAVDCISREGVLKLIYDYKENHSSDRKHYPINYGTLLDMIRWVRNLPSVTPQEPIFNKIRAEIEQTHETMDGFIMHEGTKKTVLSIIDKYKAESEKI